MTAPALAFPVAPSGARGRGAEIGIMVAVVLVIALLIVPLPPFLLDVCLAASIGVSLVVLLSALQTTDPLEFSSFPALLLILTLFRLALNVASTRLILSEGHAGQVIQAFGQFVIGGNYVVGVVLFLILVGINFIVITKGAGRVAEVAARFTLDAMPGKQMAIDADLGAGLIDEKTARERRAQIAQAADFYGAMDGASKFVKGDAIAGLLITGINIIGGIVIGVLQRGLDLSQAASTYTILTVGEGLVAQIPALIVSTAAGLMVTQAAGGARIGSVVATQLSAQPKAMWVAAGVLGSFALVPGLPALPFLVFSLMLATLARSASQRQAREAEIAALPAPASASATPETTAAAANPVADLLQLDPIELLVGYGLVPLVDESMGGDLLERIGLMRKQAAVDLGILVPAIRIRDDVRLPANEYVIRLRGSEVARGEAMPRMLLALDTGTALAPIDGMDGSDPSFGLPARWIAPARRADASALGYMVVEPGTMLATHLMETVKSNAAELLGRQDVQAMVDALKPTHPALVEEVVPAKVTLGTLHRVLQRLLRERVPIRDLVTILEALGDAADHVKDLEALTEHVRRALSNVIARTLMDESGAIPAVTLDSKLEASLMMLFAPRAGAGGTLLNPDQLAALLRDLQQRTSNGPDQRPIPLVVPPALRTGIRRLVEPVMPALSVVSFAELPTSVSLTPVSTWEMSHAA
ncbi:MAG: flagellar biosynthesis protein FlhA [Gemmatimonadetes bacterium]|nr:flagellar biosynthesis protein FlhA [Gemmatimonadota bacterium]